MELRKKSVNEYKKLQDTGGGEDAGEYNAFYKLLRKLHIDEDTLIYQVVCEFL